MVKTEVRIRILRPADGAVCGSSTERLAEMAVVSAVAAGRAAWRWRAASDGDGGKAVGNSGGIGRGTGGLEQYQQGEVLASLPSSCYGGGRPVPGDR
jgi:hypothetical protein